MHKLAGVFGMFEMEAAAQIIVDRCIKANTWHCGIRYVDFENFPEQNGFLQLLSCGMMHPLFFSKSSFIISQKFIDRVHKVYPETHFFPPLNPNFETNIGNQSNHLPKVNND